MNPVTSEVTFESLFAAHGIDSFLADYWGRKFGRFEGDPARFRNLISWDDLNELVERQTIDVQRFRLYQDGKAVDASRYIIDHRGSKRIKPASFVNCLAEGATLVFDSIDEFLPRVNALARSFEASLHSLTVVNLYAAWRTKTAFDLHWDNQDTCILQVAGSKSWKVFEPTRLHPLKDDSEAPPEPTAPPVWHGLMKQGDMLYLPRGWWHTVLPVDEPTLHLTVTIVPPSGGDLLVWLSSRLKSSPVVRQNIPAWASPVERRAHWQQLRQVLETQLTEALFEEFVAEWSAKMMPPTRIGLPSSPAAAGSGIGPRALLRLACSESLHLLESEDGGFHFFANGTKWDCPAAFVAPLKELRSGAESSLERLGAMLATPADRSRFVSFVAVLQMGGVLWTRNPSDE